MGWASAARLGMVALLILAVSCSVVSLAAADTSSRWFAPIVLRNTPPVDSDVTSDGYMEVVLQVTPATSPGPFEYVSWVTNNTTSYMTDFYLTCVGVDDIASFLPNGYEVLGGTRSVDGGGVVTYVRGSVVKGWGNSRTGAESVPYILVSKPGSTTPVPTTKIRWSVLGNNPGLAPGSAMGIGFSFVSTYAPATVAGDMTDSLAIRMYNGEVYAYGRGPLLENSVPEWSSIMLATFAFGFIAIRRRVRRQTS